MNKSISITMSLLIVFGISSAEVLAKEKLKHVQPISNVQELKKQVQSAQVKHKVGRLNKLDGKRRNALIKRYDNLYRQVMNASDSSKVDLYLGNYKKLNKDLNIFANGISTAEGGIAQCMGACDDEYPGVGGGNGINRAACKTGCLVHGGDNS